MKLLDKLSQTARKVAAKLASIPYRTIAMGLIVALGNFLHWLLFSVLLPKKYRGLKKREIYSIIFLSNSPAGKKFDIWLLILIGLNLVILIIDSFPVVQAIAWLRISLKVLEWVLTILFTFEYYLRIYCTSKPKQYIFSFYGIIDFISIFPAYLSLFLPATQTMSVFRILRTLRIFRILKMKRYLEEGRNLMDSLRRSMRKIVIFMLFVFLMAVILGAVVFMVEGGKNENINSIPQGIYWAVVTITTVGYGDISPVTPAGQFISMIVMVLGYSIIAVPTGIVVAENISEHREAKANREELEAQWSDADENEPGQPEPAQDTPVKYCSHCGSRDDDPLAKYCKFCGTRLSIKRRSRFGNFFS